MFSVNYIQYGYKNNYLCLKASVVKSIEMNETKFYRFLETQRNKFREKIVPLSRKVTDKEIFRTDEIE